MATYTFLAFDEEGHRVCGAKKFSKIEQAQAYISKNGWTGPEIFESRTKYKEGAYKSCSPKELAIFCRQMSVMFISQITVMEGLQLLSEQSENKELKTALSEMRLRMDEAHPFRDAMGMYPHIFGSYLLNMVVIGEVSGTLDSVFSRLGAYFEKEGRIRKKLKSAVTYPLVLSVLMAAIILLLIIKIIPMFQSTLATMGGQMPAATTAIFSAASFLAQYAWIFGAVIAAIVVFSIIFSRTEKGKAFFDRLRISVPGFKYVNSRVITARYSRGLAILLKSGVQVLNAMDAISSLVENRVLEGKFQQAFLKVKEGEPLQTALKDTGFFPPLFIRMATIGNDTGHLDEMLE
ncbi:MAG: type II secretion system F family protein, partial [Clostridiales bacterium]|nr:type II secretion system F family protein [Clostridiales bacterium]